MVGAEDDEQKEKKNGKYWQLQEFNILSRMNFELKGNLVNLESNKPTVLSKYITGTHIST